MDVLYLFVIVPGLVLIGICLLIYAAIRKKLPIAVMVATFCALSAIVFLYNFPIRTFTRWFLWSGQYKSKVLAEPSPVNGGLKHIEWDGWGWGGQDFSVFLVFDPTDSLSGPARRQSIRQAQWNTLRGFRRASHGLTLVYRFFRCLRRSIFVGQL